MEAALHMVSPKKPYFLSKGRAHLSMAHSSSPACIPLPGTARTHWHGDTDGLSQPWAATELGVYSSFTRTQQERKQGRIM